MTETVGLEGVFAGLDAAAVRWAVLRGAAQLSEPVHDVDLLVAEADLDTLEDLVIALDAVAPPRSVHPWHRFFRVPCPDGRKILLDVVTELTYHRRRQIRSGLAEACLARRRRVDGVWVLDPTDQFWTVLLHCLLDKQTINQRRRAELRQARAELARSSRAEEFFEQLCPPDWSSNRALAAVADEDWSGLVRLGQQLRGDASRSGRHLAHPRPAPIAGVRSAVTSLASAIYPTLWRRAGLGATPRVLGIVDTAGVDVVVVELCRRPGHCDVTLAAPGAARETLAEQMHDDGFRRVLGAWLLATGVGVERVRLVSADDLGAAGWPELWHSARPMAGRLHCRRAPAGTPSNTARRSTRRR